MSVNRTVEHDRSGSVCGIVPVRNSCVSATTASWSPKNGKWSSPGSSRKVADGSRPAMYLLARTSAARSPDRCSTSAGTWIAPRTPRMSTGPIVEISSTLSLRLAAECQ